jgi:hypothetical protein
MVSLKYLLFVSAPVSTESAAIAAQMVAMVVTFVMQLLFL